MTRDATLHERLCIVHTDLQFVGLAVHGSRTGVLSLRVRDGGVAVLGARFAPIEERNTMGAHSCGSGIRIRAERRVSSLLDFHHARRFSSPERFNVAGLRPLLFLQPRRRSILFCVVAL